LHVSGLVQAFPSEQALPAGVGAPLLHEPAPLHVSGLVQAFPSEQALPATVGAPTQVPAPLHESVSVQSLPSLQAVPMGFTGQNPKQPLASPPHALVQTGTHIASALYGNTNIRPEKNMTNKNALVALFIKNKFISIRHLILDPNFIFIFV
jgi:hypothetical protein